MQQWTDMADANNTFLRAPHLAHFNPVELSLLHLSHFATLVSPPKDGNSGGHKVSSSTASPPLSPSQPTLSPSSQSGTMMSSQSLSHSSAAPSLSLPAAMTPASAHYDTSFSCTAPYESFLFCHLILIFFLFVHSAVHSLSLGELVSACVFRGLASKDKLAPFLREYVSQVIAGHESLDLTCLIG